MLLLLTGCFGLDQLEAGDKPDSDEGPQAGDSADSGPGGDTSETGDSPPPDTDPGAPPDAPLLDAIDAFRNEDFVVVSGTAPGASAVELTADDGSAVVVTGAVSAGTFAVEVPLDRDLVTSIRAVAIAADGQQSHHSDSVVTKACDPWDSYEIDDAWPTAGDTCDPDAIAVVTSLQEGDAAVDIVGNVLEAGDEDWYVFPIVDNATSESTTGIEDFRFRARLVDGAASYSIEVLQGSCAAAAACAEPATEWEWTMSASYPDGASPRACGGVYNECLDLSGNWYVRVTRIDGVVDCTPYTLQVSNGLW